MTRRVFLWTAAIWCAGPRSYWRAGRGAIRLTCRLTKRIPTGGGLGGGSSDAAATLVTLNRMWGLDASKEQLTELAAELGSDVALFLEPGSAVISGRGEMVRPVELGWQGWIVLLIPGLHVSTPAVYRAWRAGGDPPGSVEPRPSRSAEEWMRQTFNMLEGPAIEVCPDWGPFSSGRPSMAGRPGARFGQRLDVVHGFRRRREAEAFGRGRRAKTGRADDGGAAGGTGLSSRPASG